MLAAAVFILPLLPSCADRIGYVQGVLSAADSLMQNQPQSALDTLLTIDSAAAASLRGRERADYALLMTEGRYKCWEPVAGDTSVFRSADYYRRRGPEDRLARALMMQGAVLTERGDAEGAMAAYKEAEPVAERVGDLEQLGLLNTRIAELYQSTTVNFTESIERTKAAIACFEEAGDIRRAVNETFSLASLYLAMDSLDKGYECIVKGLESSEASEDIPQIVHGCFLLSGYYYYIDPPDYDRCRKVALSAVRLQEEGSCGEVVNYRDDLFHYIAGSYAASGLTDSARYYLHKIIGTDARTMVGKYDVLIKIAKSEGDSVAFLSNKMRADSIYYAYKEKGFEQDIAKSELKSENLLIKERYAVIKKQRAVYILSAVTVLMCIVAVVINTYNKMKIKVLEAERMVEALNLKGKDREKDSAESQERLSRLQSRLTKESSAKDALISMNGRLIEMNDRLVEAYYRYGSTSALPSVMSRIIDEYFPENATGELVLEMVNAAYPGYLSSLSSTYGILTDRQMYLIALICCGFSTSTQCILYRCSENTLNVTKSRIAKKMGISVSLSAFIASGLKSYGGD